MTNQQQVSVRRGRRAPTRGRVGRSIAVAAALAASAVTSAVAESAKSDSDRSTHRPFFAEAILHAKPGQDAALLRQLQEIQRGTRAEPGNLAYDILHSVDDPLLFVVFEAFVDRASFDLHRTLPHTVAFSARGAFETLAKPEFDRVFMTPVGNTVVDDPEHDGAAMAAFRRPAASP